MTAASPPPSATEPAAPSPATEPESSQQHLVSLYQASKKVYARSVSGPFDKWRWALVFLTQIFFYGVPWLQWNARQAVLFDLGDRRFYIFGLLLYPQDVVYLSGILIISALSLFLFTTVAGRQWCGYACPQTVYTEIYMWIERKLEGDRSARMRLDAAPMSPGKFMRKAVKHLLWIVVALWSGLTLVGYFTPIRQVVSDMVPWQLSLWESFWIFFYGFVLYGFAGFMREQVCKYMCPYARFQSAMFDRNTLIVSYDPQRGEPRGARSKKADHKALGLGDCVDCTLCVQVCPTGIDIRKGLQYECISCAACVDVCNDVMRKVGYPKGLIRYTTENALQNHWTSQQVRRHVLRPRVLFYTSVIVLIIIGFIASLALRTPYRVDVIRDRATLARIADDGRIANIYRLHIMNASEKAQTYAMSVEGLDGLKMVADDGQTLVSGKSVTVDSGRTLWVPMELRLPYDGAPPGVHTIHFKIVSGDHDVVEKSVFMVPPK